MTLVESQASNYVADIVRWRRAKEIGLRSSDGWLTLVGLHWLKDGINSVGSAPDSDVPLPTGSVPPRLGTIVFARDQAALQVESDATVTVDGVEARGALLRDSNAEGGPSLVRIGTVTFFVIERGGQYAVRVRDSDNPARLEFTGRRWFPINADYAATGVYVPHAAPRTLEVMNSAGKLLHMVNPGRVEFLLKGHSLALEAFEADDQELWFIFKDVTSGRSTYGAGRFMYAPLAADGSIDLDFNKAYHPPCAFTDFATCPLPLKENILPVEIAAGECL